MKEFIHKSLNHLLFEQGHVTVPGLGTFSTLSQAATIDPISGHMTPPHGLMVFDANQQADDHYLKIVLVNHYQLSEQQARQEVTDFVRQIKSTLEKKEIAYLNGIGKLFLNHEGLINFIPENKNFNKDNFGLPRVDYNHFAKSELVTKVQGNKKRKINRQAKWSKPMPILMVAAFAIIAINVFWVVNSYFDKNPASKNQKVMVNQKPTMRLPSSVIPSLDGPLPKPENDAEPKNDKAAPAFEVEDELSVSETKAHHISGKECIIITGVFENKESAQEMIDQLYDAGYAAYNDKNKNQWRVGVLIPYEDIFEIKDNLINLSEELGTNPWILKR